MPLYDHQCRNGHIHEAFEPIDVQERPCPECGETAKRIISMSGVHATNDDARWIRDIVCDSKGIGVVSKTSTAPHVVAFRENPTRANMKAWMRGEGLRHVDPGEKFSTKPPQVDMERHHRETWKTFQKMTAVEVRTR